MINNHVVNCMGHMVLIVGFFATPAYATTDVTILSVEQESSTILYEVITNQARPTQTSGLNATVTTSATNPNPVPGIDPLTSSGTQTGVFTQDNTLLFTGSGMGQSEIIQAGGLWTGHAQTTLSSTIWFEIQGGTADFNLDWYHSVTRDNHAYNASPPGTGGAISHSLHTVFSTQGQMGFTGPIENDPGFHGTWTLQPGVYFYTRAVQFGVPNSGLLDGLGLTASTHGAFEYEVSFTNLGGGLIDITPLFPPVGDLDGDGFVGINDLNIVLGNWNQNVPPGYPLADPSGDGFVGIDDLNTVLGNWNAGTPPDQASHIPEPGSTLLIVPGVIGLIRGK